MAFPARTYKRLRNYHFLSDGPTTMSFSRDLLHVISDKEPHSSTVVPKPSSTDPLFVSYQSMNYNQLIGKGEDVYAKFQKRMNIWTWPFSFLPWPAKSLYQQRKELAAINEVLQWKIAENIDQRNKKSYRELPPNTTVIDGGSGNLSEGKTRPFFYSHLFLGWKKETIYFPSWKKTVFFALLLVLAIALALTGVGALASLGVFGVAVNSLLTSMGVAMGHSVIGAFALSWVIHPLMAFVVAPLLAWTSNVVFIAIASAIAGVSASLLLNEWIRPGYLLRFIPFVGRHAIYTNETKSLKAIVRKVLISQEIREVNHLYLFSDPSKNNNEPYPLSVEGLLRFIFNPLRWVEALLQLVQGAVFRVIEWGAVPGKPSPFLRAFLKQAIGEWVIGTVLAPISVIKYLGDIPFFVAKSVFYDLGHSIYHAFSGDNSVVAASDRGLKESNTDDHSVPGNRVDGSAPALAPKPSAVQPVSLPPPPPPPRDSGSTHVSASPSARPLPPAPPAAKTGAPTPPPRSSVPTLQSGTATETNVPASDSSLSPPVPPPRSSVPNSTPVPVAKPAGTFSLLGEAVPLKDEEERMRKLKEADEKRRSLAASSKAPETDMEKRMRLRKEAFERQEEEERKRKEEADKKLVEDQKRLEEAAKKDAEEREVRDRQLAEQRAKQEQEAKKHQPRDLNDALMQQAGKKLGDSNGALASGHLPDARATSIAGTTANRSSAKPDAPLRTEAEWEEETVRDRLDKRELEELKIQREKEAAERLKKAEEEQRNRDLATTRALAEQMRDKGLLPSSNAKPAAAMNLAPMALTADLLAARKQASCYSEDPSAANSIAPSLESSLLGDQAPHATNPAPAYGDANKNSSPHL